MIDHDAPHPTPQPAPADPPKRWYTRPWLITWLVALGGALLILVTCSVSQLFFGPMFTLASGMMSQMDIVGGYEVVDDYMTAMHYGDAERAYRVYSENAKESISLADVEAELNGPNADLYADYAGWEMGQTEQPRQRANPGAVTFEDAMEGMRLHFDGTMINFNGRDRYFNAEIVYENGAWKLDKLALLSETRND